MTSTQSAPPAQYTSKQKADALQQLDAAMNISANRTEADVQAIFIAMLKALGLYTEAERTLLDGGRLDIHAPERNFIFELKKPHSLQQAKSGSKRKGDSNISAANQMHRYVPQLIKEANLLGTNQYPYYGCLTDGCTGAVYRCDADGQNPQLIFSWPPILTKPELQNAQTALDQFLAPTGPLGTIAAKPPATKDMYNTVFSRYESRIEHLHQQYGTWNKIPYNQKVHTKFQLWRRQMKTSGLLPPNSGQRT